MARTTSGFKSRDSDVLRCGKIRAVCNFGLPHDRDQEAAGTANEDGA